VASRAYIDGFMGCCYTLDQEPNQPIGFLQMIVPPISDRVVVALAVAAAIFGNRWHK